MSSIAQVTVLQSQCIHPDWKPDMHLAYLEEECLADGVTETQIADWLDQNILSGAVERVIADAEAEAEMRDDPPEYDGPDEDVYDEAAREFYDLDILPGGKDAGEGR